jgi:hypothetical protein
MSNHFSAAYLKFPGDDARLDLTDLFVFSAQASPGKTALVIDVNPFMMGLNAVPPFLLRADLHPGAVYRINVDNDGDNQADVAFTFTFSEPENGTQAATAYYAAGGGARDPGSSGDVLATSVPVGSTGAGTRPSTPKTPKTSSIPGIQPTTWRTTSNRGPACSGRTATPTRKRPRPR